MEDIETQNEDLGNQVINLENESQDESLNINSEIEKYYIIQIIKINYKKYFIYKQTFMEDLETQNEDFGNQVINLENQTKEESLNINSELEKNRATETTKLPTLASMILSSEKDKITENVVNNFTSDMKKSYIEKMLCFLNYFRQYFRITTKEVEQRIISSFKPYNSKFYEEASNNPDLYGPFWIYTTLIFVIASGGSLSKYFNGDNSKNYFQSFVRGAGSLIYIFGFGFPFLIWGYMKFIGEVISYFYILCIPIPTYIKY